MASNLAPVHRVHNIGLHGSGSGINDKLPKFGAGGSVAQSEVWREGPWSMKGPFSLNSSKLSLNTERATEEMVKGLFFRMLAQKSKLESQISILEARNDEIHVQNKGLRNQVASLRAAVDSLEQGLKAAQSTTRAHGSTANEARALFQHNDYTVPETRGDKEQGTGVPYNRQISLANLMVSRGKSLMETPSPNAQPRTARPPNTDIVRHPSIPAYLSQHRNSWQSSETDQLYALTP
ncbi:hypothetical protein JMJ35_005524 [Cladonia borealis]|uniref:Uncharacterized protein n=1 Tax=Cladonia borealis TaxID=184061 RepID=A0AA39UAF9_9LECA|nr:hypothetical protein JMJ35_005524 [Cladonia borealis]